jgi:hypothetical protein
MSKPKLDNLSNDRLTFEQAQKIGELLKGF